jgi:hypothetical protein
MTRMQQLRWAARPALVAVTLLATAAVAPGPTPAAAAAVDTTFSFAVLPDTQQEVLSATDTRFANRTNWLVAQRSALDLRFVTHSGDVVNWDTADHAQYARAAAAVRPLSAAGIPWTLAVGNHDTAAVGPGGGAADPSRTRQLVRDTRTTNAYLPNPGLTGRFEAGRVDNGYATYDAGGLHWLVLTLELWPRRAAVDWARSVVAAHPHHNVIVVTHDYLDATGGIEQSAQYGETSPQYLWDNLVKVYPNVRLVFSGHVTGTVAYRSDTGTNGNPVRSFMQSFHDNRTNPVRLVEVDTAANTLRTRVYAPATNTWYPDAERSLTGLAWVR